ncbi:MAG: type II restriction enzyme [Eubacteriales bacterium]
MKINDAWVKLFDKYKILDEIEKHGAFKIKSGEIKEFKEPRLMAKWDSSESLPKIFEQNKINILPVSRSEYILSDFMLYQKIPELTEHVTRMTKATIPEYETIDISNITSESNSINALILSDILDDFLSEGNNALTFNGRMGTGTFDFKVDRYNGRPLHIDVDRAQCEIDAGIENNSSVVIIEAKNVVYPDLNIRQLYYPFRLWESKLKKPIRLIYTVFSNQIYRLFEYRFEDKMNYSSIYLVNEKNYSLQDTNIENSDLKAVYDRTEVIYDDNQSKTKTPFVQANSFERVISFMEILNEETKTPEEMAEIMQFDIRQSGYYFNAGKYLGLFEKNEYDDGYGQVINIELTKLGKDVCRLNYKERQLKLVELILKHRIFNDFFVVVYNTGELPSKEIIEDRMRKYNVCNEGQIERRASSVLAWLKWIFNLTKI